MTPPSPCDLARAVTSDDLRATEAELAAGADPDAQDAMGRSPLMLARSGAVVDALLGAGARVDLRDREGRAALHFAWSGATAERLIDAGADLYAPDAAGETQLGRLFARGEPVVCRLLLDRQERRGLHPTPRGARFEEAVANPHVLKALAFDEATRGAIAGRWLLFLDPIELGRLDLVRELCRTAPCHDARSVAGLDAVACAVATPKFRLGILHALLEAGFAPDVRDHGGRTALDWAVRLARPEAVRLLGGDVAKLDEAAPTDALARGVYSIRVAANEGYTVVVEPTQAVSIVLARHRSRSELEEGPWGGTPREALEVKGAFDGRAFLRDAGASWLLPVLESLARGDRVLLADLELAAKNAGAQITLQRYGEPIHDEDAGDG